jgi:RNA polymerase sigma factor (sigma-70 family)
MKINNDNQLLAEYARHSSEGAFRELVQRHVNMVHSAALREAHGNVSLAEDITQEVFTELARRAPKLLSHPALAGWLYTAVRLMAANLRRTEDRRHRREQEAYTMNELLGNNASDQLWRQVRPVLDDVMHELNPDDRAAVVLRFFEGLGFKEVGTALGLTENAARMRVERSLEKLHGLLARRGVNSTASTLAAVLVAGVMVSATPTLAASVATGALTTAAAGHSTALLPKFLTLAKNNTLAAGALAFMAAFLILWLNARPSSVRPNSVATTVLTKPAVAATVSPIAAENSPQNDTVMTAVTPINPVAPSQMAFQLVDTDSGAPLPGAKLYQFYLRKDGRGLTRRSVTDAGGGAAVDLPQAPYSALNLFVTADGHVPKVTTWGSRRPMPSTYTMKLEPGVTIGGAVVDEAGQPIAGAKIRIQDIGNNSSLAENIQFGPDTCMQTDTNGLWSCNMIPKEFAQVTLLVTDQDYAETNVTFQTAAPDAGTLVITMAAGFSIRGFVDDSNGHPVAGAEVRQVRMNEENERSVRTDPSGTFEFKNMGAGELMLAVQADGLAPAVQTIQVAGNVAALQFQLDPGQRLRGRVADEQGDPVANAFVETTRRAVDKVRWSTNTDANGRFEWNSAPKEPLLYSVLAEGYNRAYAQSLKADGSEQEIKLTIPRPGRDTIQITGTAVDAESGLPLDTFKVFVGERDPEWDYPLDFYNMGHAGKFALSFPAQSSHSGYVVQIEREGYLPAVSANLLKTNGNQQLEFKLQPGAGPSGVVFLPSGEPAGKATVLLCTPMAGVTIDGPAQVQNALNTTTYRTQTDGAGKFSVAPALDPQGLIVVHDQGYVEVSLADFAAAGEVTLQPWGGVHGTLILDSQPAANQRIEAYNQVLHYSATGRHFGFLTYRLETTTDAGGEFSFAKLPPGPCTVCWIQAGPDDTFLPSHDALVTVKPGTMAEVVLGGTGRPIIGKATLPAVAGPVDWRKVTVHLRSTVDDMPETMPKRQDFSSVAVYVAAEESYFLACQNEQHFSTLCDSDGSFRLSDVPAGSYELAIEVRDYKLNSVTPHDPYDPAPVLASLVREISIPPDNGAHPLDFGTLDLVVP